jgi:hypothetical protein
MSWLACLCVAWKIQRLEWVEQVNAATTVKDAVAALLTLFYNVLWSPKWEKPDRDKWEKELNTSCVTVSDFAKAVLFFEVCCDACGGL